jgi:ferrous iron transport protein B
VKSDKNVNLRLSDLKKGDRVRFRSIEGGRASQTRLLEMGLRPEVELTVLNKAGEGRVTVLINGARLALGKGLSEKIWVEPLEVKKMRNVKIALAGNPNSGKTTLFNKLTGRNQQVGNYPGVTVEKIEGKLVYSDLDITLVDLPGTYSLSPRSLDERIARKFLLEERPDLIIQVVDASNLERHLFLFTQLAELGIPVILAVNMCDLLKKQGRAINFEELSRQLSTPVVDIVAVKNLGFERLLEEIKRSLNPQNIFAPSSIDYGKDIEEELAKINTELLKYKLPSKAPARWWSIKCLENDLMAVEELKRQGGDQLLWEQCDRARKHLNDHFGDPVEVLIADGRYGFISGACTPAFMATVEARHDLADKIDRVILNRFLSLPVFALVMYLIFKFTFSVSAPLVEFSEGRIDWLAGTVGEFFGDSMLGSLLADGIIKGVGAVLGFFPLILTMFLAIAFFEDSGYMARAAFVMDRLMRKFGLHGKSFLPLMISTNGCAVPGIMASRTLESPRDRMITMMVTPFMVCGAKLPVFALFIGAFFADQYRAPMLFLMYFLSVVLALGGGWILKNFVFKEETSHFVMELPPYRLPTLKGLFLKMWERGWQYVKKAGTIILAVSIVIWTIFSFPVLELQEGTIKTSAEGKAGLEYSLAGRAGKLIEPLVIPFGQDWRGAVALLSGIGAKEVVISTFGVMYALGEVNPEESEPLRETLKNDPFWTPLKAFAFMMFCLIYMPCVAAVAVFYRESGSSAKWTFFLVGWTTILAWLVAVFVYQMGMFLGVGV